MIEPTTTGTVTPNTRLPLLFSGQAQGEFYINHALAVLDGLAPAIIEDALSAPPSDAIEGRVYRVLPGATGAWLEKDGNLAIRLDHTWHFVEPELGWRAYDKSLGTRVFYQTDWVAAEAPELALGGEFIDSEARAALQELLGALKATDLLAQ